MFGLSLNSKNSDFEESFNSFLLKKNSHKNSVKDDVYKIIESVRD